MDVIGYFFGALLRTAIILVIFFIAVKLLKRPLTNDAARVLGVAMFIVFTVFPIIFSGEVIINIIMGVATGYLSAKLAFWANQPASAGKKKS